ncbi:MAG: hypothetical protein BWZ10_01390 [candidate division BRC1 bacterium ADurb.BinA364]|nr:MAG: hypothetical protein BWZ10_01390 [candidate division BRC1 bacterium ADurb.BinA364]
MTLPLSPSRDLYARLALSYVPHLAQLADRNPYSPTYGCFDREYWHYRTLDFPCGMSQEMALPFALLYKNVYPGNKYQGWERMRELAVAGIEFAIKGSRRDGTCDDYFPYEQAMGALVFSTYACAEAYLLLGLDDERMLAFFRKRGDHLAKHNETGRLSNHQAFAALAAYNIYLATGDAKYKQVSEDRTALALSWQHPEEGWFQEYEGADPGYHTCTISFLAKLYRKSGNESLIPPLRKAVDFAWHFMHPDGSYGGEYGSRNTYHFYPHGFEVLAPRMEKAGQIADQFLRGLAGDKRYHNDDDRMCSHLVYDWLQAYEDYHPQRPEPINQRANFSVWMPGAGMAVVKTSAYYAVANMRKGGVLKAFTEEGCFASDTGPIGELENGRVLVAHLMDRKNRVSVEPRENAFAAEGVFSYRQRKLSSPLKMILFRIANLTVSRFFPNLVRSLVQKIMITGKKRTAWRFRRKIEFGEAAIRVIDEFPDPMPIKRLSAGTDATSIYVANSNVYQESVLRIPWTHADPELIERIRQGGARWERDLTP